jgi:glycyl-tRNA synthetase beta chain
VPTLLFEIGCEELPAGACHEAEEQLPELCRRHLGAEPSAVYVGPRRLAVVVDQLPERAPDEFRRGPAERVAFDAEGGPTKAAEGFARGHGVPVGQLERRGGHVWARIPGEPLAGTLPERLAGLTRSLTFAKSMRWDGAGLRFPRPVRWLCAKLDRKTIAVALEGIPDGGVSYGHRFTSGEVPVRAAGEYAKALRSADVEPDADERRRTIIAALDAIGGWSDPGGALDEVVYLVESPVVLEGKFDDRFLELPERVVVTAMQSHQRYFPLGGNRFAVVANSGEADTVRAGNEVVLEGRLEDASFTFERDVGRGIEALAAEIGTITFAAGAGSFADKTARLVRLVEALGGGEASLEAARLAKADQAAELVREFPDLEGHIGAEYARLAGFPEAVCKAIEEQYLPDAAGGPLPQTEAGRLLSAADKIDNLAVAFGLGQRPTGSRDPYGLRRAAIGLCRLAIEGGLRLEVRELLAIAHRLLLEQGASLAEDSDPLEGADFVGERLEGLLDVPVEFVRAARGSTLTELGAVARLARELATLEEELLERIHTAYTRADRLAGKEEIGAAQALDRALLAEEAELAVAQALELAEARISAALAGQDVRKALEAAAELGPPLDRFFDEVLVMTEDRAVRANRLRLLLDVRETLRAVGDFSQIPL